MDFAALVQTLGVPIAITIVFVIDSRCREKRMAKRLDEITDRQINGLEKTIKANEGALRENAIAQQRVADVIGKCPGPIPRQPTVHAPAVGNGGNGGA